MADTNTSEHRIELVLGPLVGLLVFLFSLTEIYERAELVTYDSRFNVRNSVFGPPTMNRHLGTIDIDLESIEAEGRYQDWTRNKYTDVVRVLHDYGARLVGFDVFFVEPSTNLVSAKQIRALDRIDEATISDLLAKSDHDELFRQTIVDAGNVYLGQTIVVPHDELSIQEIQQHLVPLSPDKKKALATIGEQSPVLADGATNTIWRGYDFDPPLRSLREASRGFAYAQTVPDVDGARRRFPLVYRYEDVLFPSLALKMTADVLQVPMQQVIIDPGNHILLPNAQLLDGGVEDVKIPIDRYGNMNVNWAGRWENTFTHYPHYTLREAAWRQDRQALLDDMKSRVDADASLRNPRKLLGNLTGAGYTDRDLLLTVLRAYLASTEMESAIESTEGLTAADFWKKKGISEPTETLSLIFDKVRRTNIVADLLAQDPTLTSQDLLSALAEEEEGEVSQSEYYVRSMLVDGVLPDAARPLYFYPYQKYQPRNGVSAFVSPEDVEGKILFYGLTAPGTTDLNVTPVQGSYPMVGIYPNVMNTILEGIFIERMPAWTDAVLMITLGLLLSLVVPRLRVLAGAGMVMGIVVIYSAIAFFGFTHAGLWLEFVAPLMTVVIGYLALTIYGYIIKEKEKEFVQGAFGHYLSPAVVDQIMTNPDMIGQLGGEERIMTAFFSDIAAFSTISECLTPAELVSFINEYLSDMCDIIEAAGGTIDKFEGDAIVAFFGAPLYYDDHAVRGCMSCIDQQRAMIQLRERWHGEKALPPALMALRDRWDQQGRSFCHVRIGLTAGPMVVGNMGSRTRTDYTMMGDTVNLAARFESGQKIYGTGIMVNEAIYEQVSDQVEGRRLDFIQVMGKEEPATAYEILERKGEITQSQTNMLGLYQQGLELYDKFEFAEAKARFEEALKVMPDDGPCALYADRCEDYASNPPEDLVFRADSK
jgi:class 3 adenylate cyclase/CHASE2 domain-containing sensor protein